MKSVEHLWLTHEYFFTVCWNQDPNKIHEQQLVHIFFTSTLLRDLPFSSPFLLSLPFLSFFSPSLSLLQFIYLLKKKKLRITFMLLSVSYLHGFQDSASIKIPQNLYPTPSTETKTNFLDEFQCYWVNYFVVL